MGGINVKRWIMGGLTAGVLIWILEGLASQFYMADMEVALEAHNLAFDMSGSTMAMTLIVSLIAGLALVFFYAASRPRFGPGPRTAAIVALAFWFGSTLISLLGYDLMGLFSSGMLAMWGAVGLVEMVIASLAGAWLYREDEAGGVV